VINLDLRTSAQVAAAMHGIWSLGIVAYLQRRADDLGAQWRDCERPVIPM
jgi:hypothetical protein